MSATATGSITITAEDGTVRTYTIVVNRAATPQAPLPIPPAPPTIDVAAGTLTVGTLFDGTPATGFHVYADGVRVTTAIQPLAAVLNMADLGLQAGVRDIQVRGVDAAGAAVTQLSPIAIFNQAASYGISLSPANLVFPATAANVSPAALVATVANTGNTATGPLYITAPAGFTITPNPIPSIPVGGTATFTVFPSPQALGVGAHNVSIAVGNANVPTATIGAGITINPPPTAPPVVPAPGGTTITGTTFSWNAVAGATNYRIYVNGVPRTTVSGTSFNLATLNLPASGHSVQVRALFADGSESARSAGISFAGTVPLPPTGGGGGGAVAPPPTATPPPAPVTRPPGSGGGGTFPSISLPVIGAGQGDWQGATPGVDWGARAGEGLTPTVTPAPRHPFGDVQAGDWFSDYVAFVHNRGLMAGTAANEFSPSVTTTRAMVVAVIYRIAGSPSVANLPNPFNDVPADAWYHDAIVWAVANDIAFGLNNGSFGPNQPIPREGLAFLFNNYANFARLNLTLRRDAPNFNDAASFSPNMSEAISRLYRAGIVSGRDGGVFDPQAHTTRAELAAILQRFLVSAGR
jgi:hypothetical protein